MFAPTNRMDKLRIIFVHHPPDTTLASLNVRCGLFRKCELGDYTALVAVVVQNPGHMFIKREIFSDYIRKL